MDTCPRSSQRACMQRACTYPPPRHPPRAPPAARGARAHIHRPPHTRARTAMRCCSGPPKERPTASRRTAPPAPAAAAAPAAAGRCDVDRSRQRLRVGQHVVMKGTAAAHGAYTAHEWRHPLSGASLAELSWASAACYRCGNSGIVVGTDTINDFVFVRFKTKSSSMLEYYTGKVEPLALCASAAAY